MTLAIVACGDNSGKSAKAAGSARMDNKAKPWWKDMYDERQRLKRERMLELIKTRPVYYRPKNDPDIYWTGIDGRIAMIDKNSGDQMIMYGGRNPEQKTAYYRFMTKSGMLICTFRVHFGTGGKGTISDPAIYRVYAIEEAPNRITDVKEARKRILLERFATFIASDPDNLNNPERQYLIIDAPLDQEAEQEEGLF
jgi:hypothetical protein